MNMKPTDMTKSPEVFCKTWRKQNHLNVCIIDLCMIISFSFKSYCLCLSYYLFFLKSPWNLWILAITYHLTLILMHILILKMSKFYSKMIQYISVYSSNLDGWITC